MIATQILRDDHKTIRGLFRQIEAAPHRAPEMAQPVLRELLMHLEIYVQLKKELLYPAARDAGGFPDGMILDESERLADSIQQLVDEMRASATPLDKDKLGELRDLCEEYFEDEEAELFPAAEKALAESQTNLGDRLERRRTELSSSPKYEGARPPEVQDPNGGEQMRKGA